MDRASFDEYIRRFNARDLTAFDDFLAPDMHMINGTLEFTGVPAMRDHYTRIWGTFSEALSVGRYVSDEQHVAIEMEARFTAHRDDPDSLFGPVAVGDGFRFRGLILYDLRDGRFSRIRVAYNTFDRIAPDGTQTPFGIPH
jgi:hypothetical protein